MNAISDPIEVMDPDYEQGLRAAVRAALEFGLEAIEDPGPEDLQIPLELLAQARVAARSGVSLDTVLRRYFAGYSMLGYVLVEEAKPGELMGGVEMKRLLGTLAGLFDRLLSAVSEEHRRESESHAISGADRLGERIERLLTGELVDVDDLPYEFSGWHLGLVAADIFPPEVLRELSCSLGLQLLISRGSADARIRGWLGGRRRPDPETVRGKLVELREEGRGGPVAIGEPGKGLAGWRCTHTQATAALTVARSGRRSTVLYADVACLTALLRDDALIAFLRERILDPLQAERDEGAIAKETLRAYLAAGQRASSSAAALGVKRHTVTRRLRVIEERIGRPIVECAAEVDLALKLDEYDLLTLNSNDLETRSL